MLRASPRADRRAGAYGGESSSWSSGADLRGRLPPRRAGPRGGQLEMPVLDDGDAPPVKVTVGLGVAAQSRPRPTCRLIARRRCGTLKASVRAKDRARPVGPHVGLLDDAIEEPGSSNACAVPIRTRSPARNTRHSTPVATPSVVTTRRISPTRSPSAYESEPPAATPEPAYEPPPAPTEPAAYEPPPEAPLPPRHDRRRAAVRGPPRRPRMSHRPATRSTCSRRHRSTRRSSSHAEYLEDLERSDRAARTPAEPAPEPGARGRTPTTVTTRSCPPRPTRTSPTRTCSTRRRVLRETPEHDRLWFEQKPPQDFDFDTGWPKLDVFAPRPGRRARGRPDADGVDSATMQAFARRTGLSERRSCRPRRPARAPTTSTGSFRSSRSCRSPVTSSHGGRLRPGRAASPARCVQRTRRVSQPVDVPMDGQRTRGRQCSRARGVRRPTTAQRSPPPAA